MCRVAVQIQRARTLLRLPLFCVFDFCCGPHVRRDPRLLAPSPRPRPLALPLALALAPSPICRAVEAVLLGASRSILFFLPRWRLNVLLPNPSVRPGPPHTSHTDHCCSLASQCAVLFLPVGCRLLFLFSVVFFFGCGCFFSPPSVYVYIFVAVFRRVLLSGPGSSGLASESNHERSI